MPRAPRLLAISDRRQLGDESLADWLSRLGKCPVDAVQIREKDLSDRALLRLVETARRSLPSEVAVLVNGRPDIALAADADGVHLPSRGLPVAAVRRRFGERLVIGLSTHRIDEVEEAASAGADYVTFGPVWPTPSKEAYGPPPGLAGLRRAAAVGVPVVALGGVTIARVVEAVAAGAAGVAGIGMFLRPEPSMLERTLASFPETVAR